MKRKTILALITVCILSFASCGRQETTAPEETLQSSNTSGRAEYNIIHGNKEFSNVSLLYKHWTAGVNK